MISFRRGFTYYTPRLLPTDRQVIRDSIVIAPFWSDADLRLEGTLRFKTFTRMSATSVDNELLNYVSGYIANQWNNATNFNGTTMLVAQWKNAPPYPHGLIRFIDDRDLIAFTNKVSISALYELMMLESTN